MSFHFRVFNYAEAFSNGRPINIFSYNDIQNISSEFNSFVHKISHVKKGNDMHKAGYILIRRNLFYDSALLDLVFVPVYSKPAHR